MRTRARTVCGNLFNAVAVDGCSADRALSPGTKLQPNISRNRRTEADRRNKMGQQLLNAPALIDPVCGMPCTAASLHSFVHGGALFVFCSEVCRARFSADPLRFIDMRVRERDVTVNTVLPSAPAPLPASVPAQIPPPAAVVLSRAPVSPVAGSPKTRKSAREMEHSLRGGLRGMVQSWLLARREGRHAEQASRELLALYRAISAEYPELADREIYQRVVMARTGCDAKAAERILDCAEESFAEWPTKRELTLCDVVHYLAVNEFLARHEGEDWMHTDIQHVVDALVPPELCVIRRKQ
jgi:YHS domain-containing protein